MRSKDCKSSKLSKPSIPAFFKHSRIFSITAFFSYVIESILESNIDKFISIFLIFDMTDSSLANPYVELCLSNKIENSLLVSMCSIIESCS